MITLRPAADRGHANFGWLDSHHTFSFGSYHDPAHMGVSALRVINDDRVTPGAGFGAHPHRDMEIISYVLEGSIEHKDSMGSHTRLNAGQIQVMSAGTGIVHSEYNPDDSTGLHFLQIWIQPDRRGVEPRYAQQDVPPGEGATLLVSPDGRDGSLSIHQNAFIHLLRPAASGLTRTLHTDRTYYVHAVHGTLTVNGVSMSAGDGMTLAAETALTVSAQAGAEALLFDLP